MRTSFSTPHTSSKLRQAAALLALSAVVASTAQAMTIREMRTLEKTEKQGSTYADYYLVGVMEGAVEAQAQAARAGAQPTICLNGRRLEPSMAKNLYTTELKRNADLYEADMPVQMVLVNALGTVYPC
ncbi:Rap1a/Tai family immunity protein [uncultured Rhodoferax sp.]|uniref:Rap1a/Tai family immunity protein n=1 Tax=uncultured Rhodoferax sp. TaxID=223188 RepID=UPI0025FEBD31|nr:Rap1a/Tai family immunity protein [uncultured Rhodoferax sp.]